ncbi:MAG: fibronectin type III domain-containing protein [bacterium]
MKRIPTLLGLLLVVAMVIFGFYYYNNSNPKIASTITPQKVKITNVADSKFSVSWITSVETAGVVEYGQEGEKLTKLASDERDQGQSTGLYQTHHITIEELQPSTKYFFQIKSGEKMTNFDNLGSPYTVTTGPVIGFTPVSRNFYGTIELPSKQSPKGTIVYVALPGAAVASTLVNASGNYAVTLSTMRTSDLRGYVQFDPSATIASVTLESGGQQSMATVSLSNVAPVPTITLGENVDFRNSPGVTQTPVVAELVPKAEIPTIFNVEPLTGGNEINAVGTSTVTLLNPSVNGETLASLRPEFRGMGPVGKILTIAIAGQRAVSDTVVIATDGTWSYAPASDLKVGTQTITVSYLGSGGTEQKIERTFVIAKSGAGGEPAFVATPSASKKASPTPVASERAAMPATESGVPVTGVITNTIMLGLTGILTLVLGIVLLF